MNLADLLEAGMLVCFGFSWPLNVVKAYRAKTARGTSLAFIILIITGCPFFTVSGFHYKTLFSFFYLMLVPFSL